MLILEYECMSYNLLSFIKLIKHFKKALETCLLIKSMLKGEILFLAFELLENIGKKSNIQL